MRFFLSKYISTASAFKTLRSLNALVVLFFVVALSPLRVCAQIDAEMVTNMGRNALSVDDYLTAIHYFNQAIESKPFLSSPYYYRAYAKFTLEDYSGAEADCNKSIALNPFRAEVYQLRGLCRIHTDNFNGAIADYSRVIADMPSDQGARYNRALCYLQLNQYKQADVDLDYMLDKWPGYYRTYMVKAQSLLEQKDTLQAMKWIDSLLVKNSNEGSAWSFKGRYELAKEHYLLADSCLTQAIRSLPSDFELYVARAQARHALGKFGLAIADYDRTIELQPQHFVAHYNRGLLRSFVGDLNRAIQDFDFVLRIEPNNTLAIYNRAQLRAQVGNYRGAIADYTSLIKAYPNFMYGYMQRASLRRKLGDVRGAQNDESVVARRNLDLAMGHARALGKKKVRLRSDHALDKYKQLVQEDPDTVRNVFGRFFGKVQNERIADELLAMYAPAFHNLYVQGYHSVGFMPEINQFKKADTSFRVYGLTAEVEANGVQNAQNDERQYERVESKCSPLQRALFKSSIALEKYDYASALNEANKALRIDSASVVALMQHSNALVHSASASTIEAQERKAHLTLAQTDLKHALLLSPRNAYLHYNIGCLLALQNANNEAIEAFTQAIEFDSRLAEAYYNRAILYKRVGQVEKAKSDLSKAGQLGLYKAYALLKQYR